MRKSNVEYEFLSLLGKFIAEILRLAVCSKAVWQELQRSLSDE